jgi:hypothetical protein
MDEKFAALLFDADSLFAHPAGADMSPHIPEQREIDSSVAFPINATPPRDPNDDDDGDDDDEEEQRDKEKDEPAVIREPDEDEED